jgi:hypothetical protein
MGVLNELTIKNCLQRFGYCFLPPFVISFLLYCISVPLNDFSNHLIFHAISGFYSITLIKLFLYSSFFMLAMAALLSSLPFFPKVLRWSGDYLARLTFDYSIAVNGVLLGILIAVMLIKKDFSPLRSTIHVVSLMTLLQFDLWFLSCLASGKAERDLRWSHAVRCGIAFIILVIIGISFYMEPWNELKNKANQTQQSTTTAKTPFIRMVRSFAFTIHPYYVPGSLGLERFHQWPCAQGPFPRPGRKAV